MQRERVCKRSLSPSPSFTSLMHTVCAVFCQTRNEQQLREDMQTSTHPDTLTPMRAKFPFPHACDTSDVRVLNINQIYIFLPCHDINLPGKRASKSFHIFCSFISYLMIMVQHSEFSCVSSPTRNRATPFKFLFLSAFRLFL